MQARVLDSGLHALAAFLHGGIRQANDGHAGTKKPLNFKSKLTLRHSKNTLREYHIVFNGKFGFSKHSTQFVLVGRIAAMLRVFATNPSGLG